MQLAFSYGESVLWQVSLENFFFFFNSVFPKQSACLIWGGGGMQVNMILLPTLVPWHIALALFFHLTYIP